MKRFARILLGVVFLSLLSAGWSNEQEKPRAITFSGTVPPQPYPAANPPPFDPTNFNLMGNNSSNNPVSGYLYIPSPTGAAPTVVAGVTAPAMTGSTGPFSVNFTTPPGTPTPLPGQVYSVIIIDDVTGNSGDLMFNVAGGKAVFSPLTKEELQGAGNDEKVNTYLRVQTTVKVSPQALFAEIIDKAKAKKVVTGKAFTCQHKDKIATDVLIDFDVSSLEKGTTYVVRVISVGPSGVKQMEWTKSK